MSNSLAATTQTVLLAQLSKSIEKEKATATFTCGGSIFIIDDSPIDDSPIDAANPDSASLDTSDKPPTTGTVSKPITLRWDSKALGHSAKIVFPLLKGLRSPALEQLVQDCAPATFGLKGKDVLDETYRKASKLDNTEFSVDFCPYELGIVDTVAQMLLPSVRHEASKARCLRAELYKLNIYSGPSGKFRRHVDTPRSERQVGSLVVCLPVDHEGGILRVRHKGNNMSFNFGTDNADPEPSIKWAAFYSDCEHEVQEVTSGHRITLTYNLFVSRGLGMLTGHALSLNPQSLPLYQLAGSMLRNPGFMREGGVLGIHLSHFYPHTHNVISRDLPSCLKGVDMAVFETFSALDAKVRLVPILKGIENLFEDYLYDEDESEDNDAEGLVRNPYKGRTPDVVGTRLHPRELDGGEVESYELLQSLPEMWPHELRYDIQWLTSEAYREDALTYLAHGNEATIDTKYSAAALLITIPPASKRDLEVA
ncbi:MAG: hypothetical protein M1820_004501 [Bogoriella megaspora]|nr:MAG: hypothetical protein M1820_004501 [Bogoriella megaspora]